ncbi:MAG TPA: cytochrome C oxidase subunit IV family protein [Thermoanaerobaculia bacterium]|nr:cytochrome C oxidase subunit IV family protein [Thermoanaerobaculia bacterium]
MSVHVSSVKTYTLIFLALMVLTAITVFVAYLDLGALNNVVMLTIAVAKATLVVLFFMHVAHATKLIKLVVVSSMFWLLLMFAFTMSDYLTRGWLGVAGK